MNAKKGFSLFEAAVVMLIASILIAVLANVIPHKVKTKVEAESHGRFECYRAGVGTSSINSRTVNENAGAPPVTLASGTNSDSYGQYCEFIPNRFAKYIVINAVDGGAGGSASGASVTVGGGAGQFTSSFFATPAQKYRIYPGAGGNVAGDGRATRVFSCDSNCNSATTTSHWVEILNLEGGNSGSTLQGTSIENVVSCAVSAENNTGVYDCNTDARCEIENDQIKVSFCRRSDWYRTLSLPYEYDSSTDTGADPLRRWKTITGNRCFKTAGEAGEFYVYDVSGFTDYPQSALVNFGQPTCPTTTAAHPLWNVGEANLSDVSLPSFFKLHIVLGVELGTSSAGARSDMANYITSMCYTGGIADYSPGSGGSPNTKGNGGAAIIMW